MTTQYFFILPIVGVLHPCIEGLHQVVYGDVPQTNERHAARHPGQAGALGGKTYYLHGPIQCILHQTVKLSKGKFFHPLIQVRHHFNLFFNERFFQRHLLHWTHYLSQCTHMHLYYYLSQCTKTHLDPGSFWPNWHDVKKYQNCHDGNR